MYEAIQNYFQEKTILRMQPTIPQTEHTHLNVHKVLTRRIHHFLNKSSSKQNNVAFALETNEMMLFRNLFLINVTIKP
jgi:hypothetical protein